MRLDLDVEIKIAIASAVDALRALAGHAQLLPVGDASGDADLHLLRDAMRYPVLVVLDHAQVELDLGAVERLRESETHRSFVVATGSRRMFIARTCATATRKTREEIGEIEIFEYRVGAGKAVAPVGRRPEFLSRRIAS